LAPERVKAKLFLICEHPVARWPEVGHVKPMDWQKIASLGIVAATAGLFLRAKLRKRKFSFERDTHCGCASPVGTKNSIVFHARKGQRGQILLKSN
jgi:hypothetical protein